MKQLIKNLLTLLKDYPGEVYFMSFYLLPLYYLRKYHSKYLFGYLLNRYLPHYSFFKLMIKLNFFHLDFLVVDLLLLSDPIIIHFRQKNTYWVILFGVIKNISNIKNMQIVLFGTLMMVKIKH